MSTITQQPDGLSMLGSMKRFLVSSSADVIFSLVMGAVTLIDEEVYTPATDGVATIDIAEVVAAQLSLTEPSGAVTLQMGAVKTFTATVDGTEVTFTVIRGAAKYSGLLTDWLRQMWLTRQPQQKTTIATAAEWLTLYSTEQVNIKATCYNSSGTATVVTLASAIAAGVVATIGAGWAQVEALATGTVVWDVYSETLAGTRLSYIQRYTLRAIGDADICYQFSNRTGGIDTVVFTGYREDDRNITHFTAEDFEELLSEYDNKAKPELTQSTGWLTTDEVYWLRDFFVSRERGVWEADGLLYPIAVTESKAVSSNETDLFGLEFTYRYAGTAYDPADAVAPGVLPDADDLPGSDILPELPAELPSTSYDDGLDVIVYNSITNRYEKIDITTLAGQGASFGTIQGDPMDNAALAAIIEELRSSSGGGATTGTDTRRVSGSITWLTGLTFRATDHIYYILGERVPARGLDITEPAADPNLDRIDVFVGDEYGNITGRAGTPSANPVKPQVADNEIELSFAYIPAGALEPSNITQEVVYDEGAAGEWSATAQGDSGIAVLTNDTTAPENGTIHCSATLAIPDATGDAPTRKLGDAYYNGSGVLSGYIYSIEAGGKKGWIVSAGVLATAAQYQSGAASNGTQNNVAIGMGPTNTAAMMARTQSNQAGMAAPLCDGYGGGGYTDWSLGARNDIDQIRFLVRQGTIKGLPTSGIFWSSTEAVNNSSTRAVAVDFGAASGYLYVAKGTYYNVLAVRPFDDSDQSYTVPVTVYSPTNTLFQFTAPEARNVSGGILMFRYQGTAPWLGNTALLVEAWNGTIKTGGVRIEAVNDYGLDPNSTEWQMVVVQLYNMSLSDKALTKLTVKLAGSWSNGMAARIDRVVLQYAPEQEPETGESYRANAFSFTGIGPHSVTFKSVGTDKYFPQIKVIQDGFDVGYVYPVTKRHDGFDITFNEGGVHTGEYLIQKYN